MIDETEAEVVPHILSEQEIMHKYWRISMNVRLASVALQRWMSSIIGLITTWSAIRLVFLQKYLQEFLEIFTGWSTG